MKDYVDYRIDVRKYSSNIIEGGYLVDGEIKYERIVAPLQNKKEGDELCFKIYKLLKE